VGSCLRPVGGVGCSHLSNSKAMLAVPPILSQTEYLLAGCLPNFRSTG
jgi:hypothetical protein